MKNYNTPYYQSLREDALRRKIRKELKRIAQENKILKLEQRLQDLKGVSPLNWEKREAEIISSNLELERDEKWSWD